MRKNLSVIMFVLLVTGMLTFAFNVQPAKSDYTWTETIYIRADGSVEPLDAPISTDDNVTYTLTDNIIGDVPLGKRAIVIERDNIVIDGAGYTIKGAGKPVSEGIDLSYRNNITIKNMAITAFYDGIYLNSSSYNSISKNNITKNAEGIRISYSLNNSISGNNITNNWSGGIYLSYSSNNTISGNNITNNTGDGGVYLHESSNNTVSRNNITNNPYGINLISGSSNNTVSGNNITNNRRGISLVGSSNYNNVSGNIFVEDGLFVYDSYGNVVVDNLVNDKPLVCLENVSDMAVEEAGQVILVNCNRIRVENLNLSNTDVGIELWRTNNTTITRNNITNNNWGGVCLYFSLYNTIFGNNITNNMGDFPFSGVITEKTGYGVYLHESSNNTVSRNNITNNLNGISLTSGSSNNTVSGNNITNNWRGIYLGDSSNNMFYHNNFINNPQQVFISDSHNNVWDDGYPSGGNYWSDYTGVDEKSGPNRDQPGSDGIGDTSYVINANNRDKYPLMNPWTPADTTPPATAINLSGVLGDNEWFSSDVTVTLSATDDNEVDKTEYTFNNVTWTTYTTPFTVTNEGTTIVYYRSIDKAGNPETIRTKTIKIDKTVPSVNAGNDQTVKVGATVTFDASASTDNVGIISYEWDFGDGTTGTGITTTHTYANSGTYTVTLTVKDAADNSATHKITVTVRSAEAFPMWIIGAGAAIAAIGIAIAALLLRKRK